MSTIQPVKIDCRLIADWAGFHDAFAAAFGFPDFYGRNLDAWIDCMTHLDTDFSAFAVPKGDLVLLDLVGIGDLSARQPDIARALLEMCAFVNFRRMDIGDPPLLIIAGHT